MPKIVATPQPRRKGNGYEIRKMINGTQYSLFDSDPKELQKRFAKLVLQKQAASGSPSVRSKLRLAEFLDVWLESEERAVRRNERKAGPYRERKRWLSSYVVPALGHIRLNAINASLVKEHFEYLADEKIRVAKRTGKPAGTRSLQLAFETLRSALSSAVEEGYLDVNPLIVPKGQKKRGPRPVHRSTSKLVILKLDSVNRLLAECAKRSDWCHMLVYVALHSGMRSGELRALQVRDIIFEENLIRVSRSIDEDVDTGALISSTPKTDAGHRDIPLASDALARLALWVEGRKPKDLVFPNAAGRLAADNNFMRRIFNPAVKAAGLPAGTNFHSLRHTYVSMLIKQGKNAKQIQTRLGHATYAITMDTYGHLFDEGHGLADDTLAGLFS